MINLLSRIKPEPILQKTLYEALEESETEFFNNFSDTPIVRQNSTLSPVLIAKPKPKIISGHMGTSKLKFKYSRYYDNRPMTIPKQFGVTDLLPEDVG